MSRRGVDGDMSLQARFDGLRSDYNASKTSRFQSRLTGVQALGSGADYHYRGEVDFFRMIEVFRHFDRNNMVVGQGITRLIDNVLQGGVRLNPKTGSDDLDAELSVRWREWCDDPDQCDVEGEKDFHEIARLTLRAVVVDGDICHLPLRTGQLQTIEAHRLRSPTRTRRNMVHGVQLDDLGKRIAYWFTKQDMGLTFSALKVGEMHSQRARDPRGNRLVFHVYNPKRSTQRRGVSVLAPVVDAVGMEDDIQFAMLVQQQIVSCFTLIRTRDPNMSVAVAPPATGEVTLETLHDGSVKELMGISPGLEITAAPGEKIEGFSPNTPSPEAMSHALLVLTFISVNLGIPLPMLLLDPSNTNFSGWRGAMDQARTGFKDIQRWMESKFYRPVYRWKVRQWLAEDVKLAALASQEGVSAFKHSWHPPTWAYIEPLKDSQADARIISERLNSRRSVLARRGMDIDEIDGEIVDDNVRLILMGLDAAGKINDKSPDAEVSWREIVGFPASGKKQDGQSRRIEDIARAVRAGVSVSTAEARVALGLSAETAEGADLLRFNDQDILQYHIENGIVSKNEARARLKLSAVADGESFVLRKGLTLVPAGGGESEADESRQDAEDAKESEESDEE